jgi:hypothetical protein
MMMFLVFFDIVKSSPFLFWDIPIENRTKQKREGQADARPAAL